MAFCPEGSIQDDAFEDAEIELRKTLAAIKDKKIDETKRPLLFVLVRTPEHIKKVHDQLIDVEDILTGYILPKFGLSNGAAYVELINQFNIGRVSSMYIMPILESRMIADIGERHSTLLKLKAILDSAKDYILNVRVGGDDFSNLYGLRRAVDQNIYEIGVIRDILVDIINVFASDYVVSGPVWEYFGEDQNGEWANGFRKELSLDRFNGFIGKTSIHPTQLPIIYKSMKVSKEDYEDAINILGWSSNDYAVAKSVNGSRMNEVKCHSKWATRIQILGQIYGVREGERR